MRLGHWLDQRYSPPARRCPEGHLLARPNLRRGHPYGCAVCFYADLFQSQFGGTRDEALVEFPWLRPSLNYLVPVIEEARNRTYKYLRFSRRQS